MLSRFHQFSQQYLLDHPYYSIFLIILDTPIVGSPRGFLVTIQYLKPCSSPTKLFILLFKNTYRPGKNVIDILDEVITMVRSIYNKYKNELLLRQPSEEEVKELIEKLNSVYSRTKLDKMKARLMANEILRLLKPHMSYKDLNRLTGVPESILCRYVRGNIIPSYEQAINILSRISLSTDLDSLLRNLVLSEKSTIIDLSRVMKDPYIIRLLTILLSIELAGKSISKIIATSESVLPLATMLGLELNSSLVLVKRRMYPGIQYYSAIIIRGPRASETIYIDKDLINRRDQLLVLADVVYTGKTLEAVLNLLSRARAQIVDIIAILAIGDQWKRRLREYKVKTLTQIPYPF